VADVLIAGRTGNAKVREYDFVTDTGQRLVRNGVDLHLIGGKLDDVPTIVRVDAPDDVRTVVDAGQFAQLQIACTGPNRNGLYDAVPGGITVVEGNPAKAKQS
jgi:hypothetical protein